MQVEEITIRVDSESARAYRTASDEDRTKFDLILSLRLKDASQSQTSLKEIMQEIGQKAQQRGLTEAELKSILDESEN